LLQCERELATLRGAWSGLILLVVGLGWVSFMHAKSARQHAREGQADAHVILMEDMSNSLFDVNGCIGNIHVATSLLSRKQRCQPKVRDDRPKVEEGEAEPLAA
jgi:hypothetical protein